uniref:Uncharacterized protein n=1 Tax=Romanomermis culicivorax TaxID=13658 RepID=A0A915JT93_ROMCU
MMRKCATIDAKRVSLTLVILRREDDLGVSTVIPFLMCPKQDAPINEAMRTETGDIGVENKNSPFLSALPASTTKATAINNEKISSVDLQSDKEMFYLSDRKFDAKNQQTVFLWKDEIIGFVK